MKTGISLLNFRPGRIGGTETYLRQLIRLLPGQLSGDVLFLVNSEQATFLSPETPHINIGWTMPQTIASRIAEAFPPYRTRRLERIIEQAGIDVMFYPQQSMFPLHNPMPTVMTVADLQHLIFPQNFPLFARAFRATVYAQSLKKANRIIAISHYVKQTLIDQLQMPSEQITVVHHGSPPLVL